MTPSLDAQLLHQRDLKKKKMLAGYQWLMLVILAVQEAEIRRTEVQSQPRQIVARHYLKKTHHEKGPVSGSRYRP
jgi:hypothetical protein